MPLPRELLEAMGRAPDDLAVHGVVADLLTEAGDPRGDFIARLIRLRETGETPDATAQAQLLQTFIKHRAAWLGPLAPRCLTARAQVAAEQSVADWPKHPHAPVTFSIERTGPSVFGDLDHTFGEHGPHGAERWSLGFPVRLEVRQGLDGSTADVTEWLTVRELWLTAPPTPGVLPLELESSVTQNLRYLGVMAGRWDDGRWVDVEDGWVEEVGAYLERIGRAALLTNEREWR